MNEKLDEIIEWLENEAWEMPCLQDLTDVDMALMYLRHLKRHLEGS